MSITRPHEQCVASPRFHRCSSRHACAAGSILSMSLTFLHKDVIFHTCTVQFHTHTTRQILHFGTAHRNMDASTSHHDMASPRRSTAAHRHIDTTRRRLKRAYAHRQRHTWTYRTTWTTTKHMTTMVEHTSYIIHTSYIVQHASYTWDVAESGLTFASWLDLNK